MTSLQGLEPPLKSILHRERIAQLIAPLRRVRPRVPFFKLVAHRRPTLWTLYRGLLRNAPHPQVRWRVTTMFRQKRGETSPAATKAFLTRMHEWLDLFVRCKNGDDRLNSVMQRYGRMIAAKREKVQMMGILVNEFKWLDKLRNRPIMTGGYLRASYFNPPLPRLNPQPDKLSMMIRARRLARFRRVGRAQSFAEAMTLLRVERIFEDRLETTAKEFGQKFKSVFRPREAWAAPINVATAELNRSFAADEARKRMTYTPQMLETIKQARRNKIVNKRRERFNARTGFYSARIMARMRKGPPAPVLAMMTEEEKRDDATARSPSQTGYVRKVKQKLGMRVDPQGYDVEEGAPGNRERLELEAKKIEKYNEWKRGVAEKPDLS
ncbi:hypothetical protein SISSUDRAFT_1124464 [Sistotremastrum suecicum HHB10207 ss-3]|uniref:Uncharacterized protein n=1 Tax=Sistotremastrum suecicum HHB10207 ss-3 TaxID=1314776 RepID=A0A166IIJ8_9AGAM|nr:hypothetical protein SISSUDRAFT_1124464 [Sistotremastrum suecicum HHB10207 ss-3]